MKRILIILMALFVVTANAVADETDQAKLRSAGLPSQLAEIVDNAYSGAIRTAQLPTSDNTIDLGSTAKSFRSAYIDTATIYGAGASQRYTAYTPTLAATPAAGTNQFVPGLNVVPTTAANNAGLTAATPNAGDVYIVYNSNGTNAVRFKPGGATQINGATAGKYVELAAGAGIACYMVNGTQMLCNSLTTTAMATPA